MTNEMGGITQFIFNQIEVYVSEYDNGLLLVWFNDEADHFDCSAIETIGM